MNKNLKKTPKTKKTKQKTQCPGLPTPLLAQGLPGTARGRARGRARKSEEPQPLTPTKWEGDNPPVSATTPGPSCHTMGSC